MYNYGDGIGTTQGRPYQGYPYVNPVVIDVPSIDAAAAARWNNLPRRPAFEKKEESPVVYIDIPSGSGMQSTVSQPNTSTPDENEPVFETKVDPDENPVVYIDLPENSVSDVAERRAESEEESFVQDTIFYDPFKDRLITPTSETSATSPGCSGGSTSRPPPPNTLDLGSPNPGFSSSSLDPNIPQSLAKEVSLYRPIRSPEDFYPHDNRDFPEPPPAYTEHDTTSTVNGTSSVSQIGSTACVNGTDDQTQVTTAADPPRTQVITPDSNQSRKYLYCAYCGVRTHALTIKQAGLATHVIALIFLFCGLFPMTIFIYCTDVCKYINYYCKNCNTKIAYEIPVLCQELNYVIN